MEVLLVSGFLGAGKTTLIRHLLRSRPQGSGKLAVIVNEVGEV
ncbi:MAG: GTP-binding protein, partial [Deltaproteobacteria bacterium]|nr:GTP-binding protein [Deltaproteobacteria bacterium]MCP4668818.1 GTP-binding protein [Deltaproteobacteria bacterium]